MKTAPFIGASFSHRHMEERGIPLNDALNSYGELNLPWVRLGCYWNEIEKRPGEYDYSMMHRLLKACTAMGLQVVMTVGMKAPRWPEYYLPDWLEKRLGWRKGCLITGEKELTEALFAFISQTVGELRGYQCIKKWQSENEPLDPSGPGSFRIAPRLLEKEVQLIRSLDPARPLVISVWGNELKRRGYCREAARLADVIGLDLYSRVPVFSIGGRVFYRGMEDSEGEIRALIGSLRQAGKTVWISELQAELWGRRESCTPAHIVENTRLALRLGVDGIFLWGFEYWLHEKLKGNMSYWEAACEAIRLISLPHEKGGRWHR